MLVLVPFVWRLLVLIGFEVPCQASTHECETRIGVVDFDSPYEAPIPVALVPVDVDRLSEDDLCKVSACGFTVGLGDLRRINAGEPNAVRRLFRIHDSDGISVSHRRDLAHKRLCDTVASQPQEGGAEKCKSRDSHANQRRMKMPFPDGTEAGSATSSLITVDDDSDPRKATTLRSSPSVSGAISPRSGDRCASNLPV